MSRIERENTYRWVCEISTAVTFIFYLVHWYVSQDKNSFMGVYLCSTIIALFTLLSNLEADSEVCSKIGTGVTKARQIVLNGRKIAEVAAKYIIIIATLSFIIVKSFGDENFAIYEQYAMTVMLWAVAIVSLLCFLLSLLLKYFDYKSEHSPLDRLRK